VIEFARLIVANSMAHRAFWIAAAFFHISDEL
jgi:hypothetical protein